METPLAMENLSTQEVTDDSKSMLFCMSGRGWEQEGEGADDPTEQDRQDLHRFT